jgi:hypothetical protein
MRRGTRRLLQAPLTLEIGGAPVSGPQGGAASLRHRALFEEYREEVDFVTAAALQWWNETLTARKEIASDPAEAVRNAWIDRPAGPASYPGVVALVRDYWLACHELNKDVAEPERVPPWTFLLEWLLDGQYDQCVSVLACMPYWPVGLDRDGNWV